MARSVIALVKPELLIWAREYARLNLDIVSKKTAIRQEKIQNWEEGKEKPTVKQLKKLAKIYNQSFAAFYLPSQPKLKLPKVDDFRKFPIQDIYDLPYELTRELNSSSDRRKISIELFKELGEKIPEFPFKFSVTDDPRSIAKSVRNVLGISIEEQIRWANSRTAFNNWRHAIEKIGILVFQSSQISLDVMRGFSLSEFPLPVIEVNRKDVYVARIFTLLHELAHLIIHQSGICDIHNDFNDEFSRSVEVFCNEFAGSFLVPQESFLFEDVVKSKNIRSDWEIKEIDFLSNKYCVSREVILRRLLINNKITEPFYNNKKVEFFKDFKKKPRIKGFVPPALNSVSLHGRPYTSIVFEALHKKKITTTTVSEYLGVKAKHLEKIKNIIGMA